MEKTSNLISRADCIPQSKTSELDKQSKIFYLKYKLKKQRFYNILEILRLNKELKKINQK